MQLAKQTGIQGFAGFHLVRFCVAKWLDLGLVHAKTEPEFTPGCCVMVTQGLHRLKAVHLRIEGWHRAATVRLHLTRLHLPGRSHPWKNPHEKYAAPIQEMNGPNKMQLPVR